MCYWLVKHGWKGTVSVLSHGQAAVERGFSVNSKVLNVNVHQKSITFYKLTIDHWPHGQSVFCHSHSQSQRVCWNQWHVFNKDTKSS